MLRSFKLKFFLLVTVAIVLFAIVTRISVRHVSSKPLHELLYANFASFLALTIQADSNTSASTLETPAQLKKKLLPFFAGLDATQMLVGLNDSSTPTFPLALQNIAWRKPSHTPEVASVVLGESQDDGHEWIVFKANLSPHDLWVAVPVSVFQKRFEDIMVSRETILNNMWPMLLLYIFVCTWFLTSWVLRSLKNLQSKFKDIEIKGQGIMLSEKQFDVEFSDFIGFFNSLIKRLQNNFEQASRFSSDAAHELRTPLTVIRGNLKRLLNRAPDNSPEQIQLSMLSDEVERLISITNKLVLLSQADGDNLKLDLRAIPLLDVIAVIGEDIQSLAPHVRFEYAVNPEIKVLADPSLFQQFLNNLVSNALKYTPAQGQIKFSAKVSAEGVVLTLANETFLSLDGLDDRIFLRFYRHLADSKDPQQRPKGDGLGLSLCQEIARTHGSTLSLHTGPGRWVTFKATWKTV